MGTTPWTPWLPDRGVVHLPTSLFRIHAATSSLAPVLGGMGALTSPESTLVTFSSLPPSLSLPSSPRSSSIRSAILQFHGCPRPGYLITCHKEKVKGSNPPFQTNKNPSSEKAKDNIQIKRKSRQNIFKRTATFPSDLLVSKSNDAIMSSPNLSGLES